MRRPLLLVCLAFVVTVFIVLQLQPVEEHTIAAEDETYTATGTVTSKEYKNDTLLVYLTEEDGDGLICYMDNKIEPRLGSMVQIRGTVRDFMEARNPGGFDQRSYYQLQGIYGQLRDAIIVAQSEEYSVYREQLYRLRRRMEHVLERYLNEKDASIMKAMILGNKTELDADSKQLYQKSGIAHILAISGLHISLLGMGLYRLLKKLRIPTAVAVGASVALMIAYGDMVGMSSSAFRAIFMFAMKMGAELVHRTYDMLTALALAAVGVLLEQPLYLYQAGFLLSFGAIVGIGCMSDVIKTDRIQVPQKIEGLLDGFCSSLSVFTIHFPIMLACYYEFPIYSFVLNLIVIPAMGLVMTLGLVCIGCGSVALLPMQGIAQLTALGTHILLFVFEWLCRLSLKLPGATWITGRPSTWRIVGFYLIMLLMYALHRYSKECEDGRVCLPFAVKGAWLLAAVVLLTQKNYGSLTVTAIDVGQGDGIWLETDSGHHYLIDGGSTSKSKIGQYTLIPYLKYMGTDTLDAIFLTHLDEDHISGVRELLEDSQGICIRRVVVANAVIHDEAYEELVNACQTYGVTLSYAAAGDVITDGGMTLRVLHPSVDYTTDSRNAYSLVMALEYQGFHALFTGDVEADGETYALEELGEDWHCHLYKAAHHGSKYSNTQALLEALEPDVALISCGEDNSYGHPHAEVLDRLDSVGSRIYRTDEGGATSFRIRGGQVEVQQFLTER